MTAVLAAVVCALLVMVVFGFADGAIKSSPGGYGGCCGLIVLVVILVAVISVLV